MALLQVGRKNHDLAFLCLPPHPNHTTCTEINRFFSVSPNLIEPCSFQSQEFQTAGYCVSVQSKTDQTTARATQTNADSKCRKVQLCSNACSKTNGEHKVKYLHRRCSMDSSKVPETEIGCRTRCEGRALFMQPGNQRRTDTSAIPIGGRAFFQRHPKISTFPFTSNGSQLMSTSSTVGSFTPPVPALFAPLVCHWSSCDSKSPWWHRREQPLSNLLCQLHNSGWLCSKAFHVFRQHIDSKWTARSEAEFAACPSSGLSTDIAPVRLRHKYSGGVAELVAAAMVK